MPRKIAFIYPVIDYSGGVERVFAESLKYFSEKGWDTRVFCEEIDPSLEQYAHRIKRIRSLKWLPVFLNSIRWILCSTLYALETKKREPVVVITPPTSSLIADVITTGSCHFASKIEDLHNRRYRWVLNPVNWLIILSEYITYNFSSKIIAVPSTRTGSEITTLFSKSASKIIVAPLGVDLEIFKPANKTMSRRNRANKDAPLQLLTVANELERKGVLLVLDALKSLKSQGLHFHYSIVGRNIKPRHHRYVTELGLDDCVVFEKPALQNDLNKLYQRHDMFIIPTSYEAFCLVCAEAICAGLPVISTSVGGIEDYMEDGRTGHFIERNVSSIEMALTCFHRDRQKIHEMRQHCAQARSGFIWSKGLRKLEKEIISQNL